MISSFLNLFGQSRTRSVAKYLKISRKYVNRCAVEAAKRLNVPITDEKCQKALFKPESIAFIAHFLTALCAIYVGKNAAALILAKRQAIDEFTGRSSTEKDYLRMEECLKTAKKEFFVKRQTKLARALWAGNTTALCIYEAKRVTNMAVEIYVSGVLRIQAGGFSELYVSHFSEMINQSSKDKYNNWDEESS